MPYIQRMRRGDLEPSPRVFPPMNAGELNFQITRVIEQYRFQHGDSYGIFNDIIGALESAKLEFYRRVVAPYEDKKRAENGDVYNLED